MAIVERTPLDRVPELDLDLLAAEAGPLVAGILDALPPGCELDADARRRASILGTLRSSERACAEVPRDLAALQSVLIESLGHGDPGRMRIAGPGPAPQRLAELFGSLQGALTEGLVAERDLAAGADESGALPENADLDQWLAVLVAEHQRYGRPFALALLELEGLGRIFETHGRQPGEVMLAAATTVIRNQIRIVDHAFRLDDGGFCVLAPNVDAERLRRMADRLARVVDASQAPDGPRIAISAGISGCPEHGHDAGRLLAVAEDALGAAKVSGEPVQVALNGARTDSPA